MKRAAPKIAASQSDCRARNDQNAMTALRKWEFEPARRDGAPVDVDVVIEIPFRLKPRK